MSHVVACKHKAKEQIHINPIDVFGSDLHSGEEAGALELAQDLGRIEGGCDGIDLQQVSRISIWKNEPGPSGL